MARVDVSSVRAKITRIDTDTGCFVQLTIDEALVERGPNTPETLQRFGILFAEECQKRWLVSTD